MGTRNLTFVQLDGAYKVAQYGQWDGYPDGQGTTVLEFAKEVLTDKDKKTTFINQLKKAYYPTDAEVMKYWHEMGADSTGFVSMEIADKFKAKYPSLYRDLAADILGLIYKSNKPIPLDLQTTFAADSLFCEWAYVLDLDTDTFEVYKGFNKTPLESNERFFGLTDGTKKSKRDDIYHPVKLVASFKFSELPTKAEFLDKFKKEDEE